MRWQQQKRGRSLRSERGLALTLSTRGTAGAGSTGWQQRLRAPMLTVPPMDSGFGGTLGIDPSGSGISGGGGGGSGSPGSP